MNYLNISTGNRVCPVSFQRNGTDMISMHGVIQLSELKIHSVCHHLSLQRGYSGDGAIRGWLHAGKTNLG